jgi:uncharacterized protein (DUF433 family)
VSTRRSPVSRAAVPGGRDSAPVCPRDSASSRVSDHVYFMVPGTAFPNEACYQRTGACRGQRPYTCIWCSRMDQPFVERCDDGLYVVGSRVPLDSIVLEFRDGQSPEAIRSDFPTLSLEQVYGAITFYLGHKEEVDREIAAHQRVEDAFSSSHPAPSHLKEKLEGRADLDVLAIAAEADRIPDPRNSASLAHTCLFMRCVGYAVTPVAKPSHNPID